MNIYGNLSGGTAHTAADATSQAEKMRTMSQAETALGRAEAARILRMRQEEAYRREREAVQMDALPENQAAPVAPTRVDVARPSAPAPVGTAPVGTAPAAQAPVAQAPAARQVGPGPNGGWDSYRAPLTPAELQAQMDRLALLKAPAAAADVFQAPMAGALNLGFGAVNAASNFGNRVVNAVTGEPTLPTNREVRSFGLTPFYDKIRAEEARIKAYQKGALNLNKPNLEMPVAKTSAAETPAAQASGPAAQAPAAQAPAAGGLDFNALVAAVRQVESGGNPNAVSPKGAVGPMQTMPATLTDPGYGVTPAKDNSVEEQTRVGVDYLQAMLGRYGDLEHALVAYNWGPTNADEWVAAGADKSKLPKETREYLPKVMAELQAQAAKAPADQAPAQTQAAQASGPAAQAPAAQPATMFSPEYINNTAAQTGEELRLARVKLAEINRRLSYAPDLATAQKLRTEATKISQGSQNAVYRDAAVRAAVGDENAMAQLAQAAGVQYAQTPQGYVQAALDPTTGEYRAVSQPMSREEFVNNLYSVVSGAAAKQAAAINEQNIKDQGEMRVARQKFGDDLRMEQFKAEQALQKLIVEAKVKPTESKITISSFDGKAYVTNKFGVFMVEPGRDLGDGITAEPTLVPVGKLPES